MTFYCKFTNESVNERILKITQLTFGNVMGNITQAPFRLTV